MTKSGLTLLVICIIHALTLSSQNTIWLEDFNSNDGIGCNGNAACTAPPSGKWTTYKNGASMSAGDWLKVQNNKMEWLDTDGQAVWESEVVSISGYLAVQASADWQESYNGSTDYLRFYYKLDGGAETAFTTNGLNTGSTLPGDNNSSSSSVTGLTGSTIQIVVRGANSSTGDQWRIDNVLIEGTLPPCTNPTSQPTGLVISNPTTTSLDLAWTNTTSTDVIVVIRETSFPIAIPSGGNFYSGNTVFGSGDELGNSNFVVYSGPIGGSSPLTVTGLNPGTDYTVSIYAVNSSCINTSSGLTVTGTTTSVTCTPPSTSPSSVAVANTTSSGTDLSWTNGNGNTSLVVAVPSGVTAVAPGQGITYSANSFYGSGDQTGYNNYVVYSGTGTSVSVSGLSPNTTYDFYVYTFDSGTPCYNTTPSSNSTTTTNDLLLTNGTFSACGGTLYDDGGTGNYTNGATIVMTLLPEVAGDIVCVDFTTWSVTGRVKFYDGTTVGSSLIYDVTNDWQQTDGSGPLFAGPGMVCSTGGALTIEFNPSGVDAGFVADVLCHTPSSATEDTCIINATASATTICPGESVDLSAYGQVLITPLSNDFNASTIGTDWTSTVAGRFDNPCGGYNGTPALWMGVVPAPRALTSGDYDLTNGGSISFAFMQADDNGSAPCEGPDREEEGIFFQYSTDAGASWTTMSPFYQGWTTGGSGSWNVQNWIHYNYTIPLAARTAATRFRWYQAVITSASTDHWGIDEVIISTPVTTQITWEDVTNSTVLGTVAGNTYDLNVTPTGTTTYRATIEDLVSGTTCFEEVTIDLSCPACQATITPAATDACQGATSNLTSGISGTQGANPTYSWSSPDFTITTPTASSASISVPGAQTTTTYNLTLTYTDDNGCNLSETTTFDVNACVTCTASITPAATDACPGAISNLTSGVSGTQGGNPTYSWSSPDFTVTNPTASSASISIPGAQVTATYNLTLTYTDDSGCNLSEATSFDVTVCPACIASITPAASDVCDGATSTLTSGISGTQGTNPTFSWSSTDFTVTNPTASSASIAVPGGQTANTYNLTLTYTDDNGCNLSETTSFDVSSCVTCTASITPAASDACQGATANLTSGIAGTQGSNPTYSWSSPDFTINSSTSSSASISVPNAQVTATYNLTLTYTDDNGCNLSETTSFDVNACITCTASIGTISVTGATLVGTDEYDLEDGNTINFSSTGYDENGGTLTFGYAVFDCDPGLPFSPTELTSLLNHPCYVGSDYGATTSDNNAGGVSGSIGGLDPVWVVPYTSDVAAAPDNDGDGCYAIGNAIQINYLEPPTCPATVGSTSITGTGLTAVSANEYNLDAGGTIDFNLTGTNDNGGSLTLGYAVFNCDPGLPLSAAEISDLNNNACYLGSDYGLTTSDFNNAGVSGTIGGQDPVWVLPYTSDFANSPDFDGDGCYDIGEVIQINYLDPCAVSLVVPTTDASCYGFSDGTASANLSGGLAPLTYSWSNIGSGQNPTNLPSGSYTVTVTDDNNCSATATISISEPTELVTSITTVNAACGGSNGTASVTASGGGTSYSYLWTDGTSLDNVSNLASGAVGVTITDSNGCINTESGVINNPIPAITVSNDIALACNGDNTGTASVTATGGALPYDYAWSNGQTTSSISGLVANTYTVTVEDNNGCSQTGSVEITEPAALNPTYSAVDPTCFGQADGSISTTVTGGTTPYGYLWNNGSTLSNLTGLVGNNYSVTISDDNGCVSSQSFTLTEPDILSVSITKTDVDCFGNSHGTATATASGGTTPINYLWNNGSTNSSLLGSPAGIYSVTVTDNSACSASSTVTITEPLELLITLTSNDAACGSTNGSASVSATGGDSSYSYLWSNGDISSNASGLSTGSVSITVTDGNGCSAIETSFINNPVPTLTITNDFALDCYNDNDGAVTVTAANGTLPYSYLWSTGETTSSISGLTANTYSVTVIDNISCTQVESVEITQPLPIDISTTVTDPSCFGASDGSIDVLTTLGTTPYGFVWSNGATTESISAIPGSVYFLTVTDAAGCASTSGGTVINPAQLAVSITNVNATCGQSNGTLFATTSGGTPSYDYTWSTGGSSIILANIGNGNYSVTVEDANNCLVTATSIISSTAPSITVTNSASLTCAGNDDAVASTTVTDAVAPITYLWSDGQTGTSATGLGVGVFTVTVTDDEGCILNGTTSVTSPAALSASSSSSPITCNGDNDGSASITISGGTLGYTTLWDNGGTNTTLTGLSGGNYNFTITDANNCTYSSSQTVAEPQALNITLNASDVTCNNNGSDGSITTTVTGGSTAYGYLWNDGITTSDNVNIPSGNYSVTVTDINGCTITENVTVNEPSTTTVTIDAFNNACLNASVGNLTASPIGGVWSGSVITDANLGTLSAATSGASMVYYTVSGYCGGVDSASISIFSPPSVSIDTTETTCATANDGKLFALATGNPPFNYNWSNNQTTDSITDLAPGSYSVTLTDVNGCQDTVSATIVGNPQECRTVESHYYVPNIFSPNGDGENDILYVYGDGLLNMRFIVYDRWGEKVFETESLDLGWDGTFRGQPMNSDVFVYYIEVTYLSDVEETITEKGNLTLIR